MSRATVTSLSGNAAQRSAEQLLGQAPNLLFHSIDQYFGLLQRGTRLLADVVSPALSMVPSGCCDVPEQDCPPRCVCQIQWEAGCGETVQAQVKVTNTGSATRNFAFAADPLTTGIADEGSAEVAVTPASATLSPGQSALVRVAVNVGKNLASGKTYSGELLIRGAFEQCVSLHLDVACAAACRCEVEQGDIPVRIRAHQWYEHFQCVEPCRHDASLHERTADVATAPAAGAKGGQ